MVSKLWLPPNPATTRLTVPRSKPYDPPKWWKQPFVQFSWHKVWNGLKCNFSSVCHKVRKVVGKLTISLVRMCNFTRTAHKTKRLWLSIIPARRPSEQPSLRPPQKGVNYHFSSPHFSQAVWRWKALNLGRLNMQFQQDWPKDKKTVFFNFLPENSEKFRSTELNDAPLEGSTIFLYHSSLGHTELENCWLAESKYAIFSRTGRKSKKLRRSNGFPSTVFKHGLLDGSTILL